MARFSARKGESKASRNQRAARQGIAMVRAPNLGGSSSAKYYKNSNANVNRSSKSSSNSKSKAAADAKQQAWLDKSGGIADKQTGIGDSMKERADRIGNRDIAAGEASSEVAQSYDGARGQMNRNLARSGANPNSGRFAHGQRTMANARAAADAGARTQARRNADRDSMQAYGQTQNAYSQAGQTNFGVYDRYDKWNSEIGADENYNSPTGSNFGTSTIGGRKNLGSRNRVDHNALSRSRTHVTFNKNNGVQYNDDNNGQYLGPSDLQTPLNDDFNPYDNMWGGINQNVNDFGGVNNRGNTIINDSIRLDDSMGGYGYNREVWA